MDYFKATVGDTPIVATAIHAGHLLRPDAERLISLDETQRLREEDPFTGDLTAVAATRLIGRRSRFEVDLNRPREQAVYQQPADAWGLDVWRTPPGEAFVAESLAGYDAFYAACRAILTQLIAWHGRIVVLDIHSYNHRRDGTDKPCADCRDNPEVNLGVASVDLAIWGRLVDRFAADLRSGDAGDPLDVRANVKFRGGHFPRWVNATFPGQACAIAIEFKKTFMDEWTGERDRRRFEALQSALQATSPGLLTELHALTNMRANRPA